VHPEQRQVAVERLLVEPRDRERVLVLGSRLREQLVLTVGVDRGVVLQAVRRIRSVSRKVRRFPTWA